jgi:Transcriptional regulators
MNGAHVFKRPPTAQEAVLVELRRAIVEGELAPGTQIVQEALAERLGLSRVPIREALKILEGEGQVSYSPHRGYFVTELDLDDIREVYRIRRILESDAAVIGVPRLTDADLVSMAVAVEDLARASAVDDMVAMTAANRRFHFTIIEASGMPRLTRLVRQLWDAIDPYRVLYYTEPSNRETVDRQHREILAAVRARDTDRVVTLLDEHREHAIARFQQILGPDDDLLVGRRV